jgi:hypothetical protein
VVEPEDVAAFFKAALELKSAAEFVLNDRDDAVARECLAHAIETFDAAAAVRGARLLNRAPFGMRRQPSISDRQGRRMDVGCARGTRQRDLDRHRQL